MTPFSLRVFVPDGLRIEDRTNWNGKALVFPRAAWAQPTEPTLSEPDRADMQVPCWACFRCWAAAPMGEWSGRMRRGGR